MIEPLVLSFLNTILCVFFTLEIKLCANVLKYNDRIMILHKYNSSWSHCNTKLKIKKMTFSSLLYNRIQLSVPRYFLRNKYQIPVKRSTLPPIFNIKLLMFLLDYIFFYIKKLFASYFRIFDDVPCAHNIKFF